MRVYLLPISSRRTLLYAQRLNTATTTQEQSVHQRVQAWVARTWAGWEKKEKGWQKKVVEYGNTAFRRIPFEEWGLKSVPPLSARRRAEETDGSNKVEVVYPHSLIPTDKVTSLLHTMSTERQSLHKSRMIWCIVGMPITAPFALVPVIPNLPFFYLAYRAWSHWHALAGGKHLQFLLKNNLLTMRSSPVLEAVYAQDKRPVQPSVAPISSPAAATSGSSTPESTKNSSAPEGEILLLSQANGKKMTQELDLPQLEVELERAIWQVDRAIKSEAQKTPPTTDSNTKVVEDVEAIKEKKNS